MSEVRTMLEGRRGDDRELVGILSVVGRYCLDPAAAARKITESPINEMQGRHLYDGNFLSDHCEIIETGDDSWRIKKEGKEVKTTA